MSGSQPPDIPIFRDPQGHALRFFLDVSNIEDGSKLIRSIKRHGGRTVRAPKEAQILLVDRNKEESVKFAEEWENKLSLHISWVYAAIRAEKYQDASQNWGGHRVGHGTLDLPAASKSPLPTPRHTPVSESTTLPTGVPIPSSQAVSNALIFEPSSPFVAPPAAQYVAQQSPDVQTLLQTLSNLFPAQAQTAYTQLGISTTMLGPSSVPATPVAPAQLVQTILDMIQRSALNSEFAQMGISWGQPDLPFIQQLLNAQSAYPGILDQEMVRQDSPTMNALQGHMESVSTAGRAPSVDHDVQTEALKRKLAHREPPACPTTSKGKRRADYAEEPRKERRRDSPSLPAGTSSTSGRRDSEAGHATTEKVFVKISGEPVRFSVALEVRNRQDIVTDIKKNGGTITSERKIADYFMLSPQADHFEDHLIDTIILQKPAVRPEFVYSCIREGHMVDPEDHSFHGINLKPRRGRPWKMVDLHALREAHTPESKIEKKLTKKAGTSQKVQAWKASNSPKNKKTSIEGKKSKPSMNVQEATPSSSPMRVEVVLNSNSGREREAMEVEEESESEEEGMPEPAPPVQAQSNRARIHSSSPAPPEGGVEYLPGKNYYTVKDIKFFEAYVQHLLKYTPDMSLTMLSQKLCEKASYHSERSWYQYCTGKGRPVIERARNKAYITLRKTSGDQQQGRPRLSSHTSAEVEPVQSTTKQKGTSASVATLGLPSNTTVSRSTTNYVAEDLDLIIEYLRGGIPEDVSDDQIFAQLASQHPCRAASTWADLWDLYHDTIEAAVVS